MNYQRTPLFDVLKKHQTSSPISFHVPGHKNGTFFHEKGERFFSEILKIDLTEITNLDDLHAPEGAIKEAQSLAAHSYGVQSTYFLVNGSTVGNLAMIMSCCQDGDIVLVQRNCHKSIIHGILLSGAIPVYLSPNVDEELLVPSYVSTETVRKAIDLYPDAKAIILTNPNYYGLSYTELNKIVEVAHRRNIPVLVDEAHGAHFPFSNLFPNSSISAGADIVVQSAHKTLPALTMGAYLHFNSERVDESELKKYLTILQSSSPSYLIMASLDLARAYMDNLDDTVVAEGLERLTDAIDKIEGIEIVRSKDLHIDQDPLKVTVRSTNGLSGFDLQHLLERQGIFTELADPNNVLFVLPLIVNQAYMSRLNNLKMDQLSFEKKKEVNFFSAEPSISMGVSSKQLRNKKKCLISLEQAIGKTSAEMIVPYPPGIPLLMEGEQITKDHIHQIRHLLSLNGKIQGGDQLKNNAIYIYE
ncbi:aminotransferase class I/II-fold pyridoxal phosphate-dependent enzyme [Bacillus kexueae]|uniref:aminotransferase class I/II-fold pyridoxal phosphate-dependent enzyme n=1 Tax=Aeribacillus kexueae TaxID=2078952 RepID=UPI001FAF4326|nr:aminotransferase class I/II-fold pyridoxal phosphate-dependent enzyme [Bacillus kexueae]